MSGPLTPVFVFPTTGAEFIIVNVSLDALPTLYTRSSFARSKRVHLLGRPEPGLAELGLRGAPDPGLPSFSLPPLQVLAPLGRQNAKQYAFWVLSFFFFN